MCQKALKNCDKISVENILDPEMKLIFHDKPKAILVVFSDCYYFLDFLKCHDYVVLRKKKTVLRIIS